MQPDSIIPNLYNPQSLNRYSYVQNNPIRFNDPTGHRICDDIDGSGNCHNGNVPTSPAPPPPSSGGSGSCNSQNPSIVCLNKDKNEDELIYSGYTITDPAYPLTQVNITGEDKMMADLTGVWLLDLFLLAHDIVAFPIHSDWIAKHVTHESAIATVKYEINSGEFGKYVTISNFTVTNYINSPITVEGFNTELYRGEPSADFYIQPGKMTTVSMGTKPIVSASINIYLSDGMKLSVTILPKLP